MAEEGQLVLGVAVGARAVGISLYEDNILVFGPRDAGCGPVIDDEFPASCTVGGRTVVGGLLPQGATRAIAIDRSGREYDGTVRDGLYVIEAGKAGLWQDLVRFEDEHGALVPQPLPNGRRIPVPDAPEPCPLCAVTAWVEIRRVAYCGTCGFCLGETIPDGDDADEALDPPGDDLPDPATFFASLPCPVYSGGDMTGASFATVGGGLPEEVAVQSGLLHVASGTRRLRDLRRRLAVTLRDGEFPVGRSGAARRIHEDHRERVAFGVVAGAGEIEARTFTIDGRPVPFSFLAAEDAWAATCECDGVFVTAWARGLDPGAVEFERLRLGHC